MKIAVLLCAYNGEKYIRQQLESIASQTLMPSTLFVYDWGSKDKTVSIVESFKETTSLNCILIKKDKPIGVAKGFKYALKEIVSSTESYDYIAFSDQDDIWLPEKLLEYSKSIARSESVDLLFSDVSITDSDGVITELSRNHTSQYFTTNLNKLDASVVFANPVVGMTMMISKRLAKIYTDCNIENEIMHDWSLSLICYLKKFDSMYIDKPLVLYRQHSNNVLGNSSEKTKITLFFSMRARMVLIRKHFNALSKALSINSSFSHVNYLVTIPRFRNINSLYKITLIVFVFLDLVLLKIGLDKDI